MVSTGNFDSIVSRQPLFMDRTDYINAHPNFPWLSLEDPDGVERFLVGRGWLEDGERFVAVEKAGEGNMNLTLRISTDRRSVILKQARPWVEKYDHIAAPWDRMLYEQRFYERAASIPEVARRMPKLLAADQDAAAILLEDLTEACDLSSIYAHGALEAAQVLDLAAYLRALHEATFDEPAAEFENRQMRELNHLHIFVVPLDAENGLTLENFEPGLIKTATRLQRDKEYVRRVRETGDCYLSIGRSLVHGDFFPGSWLATPEGICVIDAEFCFFGDPEFDLGGAIAHFALARQSPDAARLLLGRYTAMLGKINLDEAWIARYAAVEIMRRLIGVAQLPIPPSEGFRSELLDRSRRAMFEQCLEPLWD
jgi:5-methylthioribose kinase